MFAKPTASSLLVWKKEVYVSILRQWSITWQANWTVFLYSLSRAMKNTEEWLLNKIFIKLGIYIQKRYCKNVHSKIYALTKPHGTKYIQKLHWVQILYLSSIIGHRNYPWKCFVTPVRFFWRKVIFFICELLSIVDAT